MRILPGLILIVVLGFIFAPVGMIFNLGFADAELHYFWPTLMRYGGNTVVLVLLSVLVAFLVGVIPAFFVSLYRFPGRNFFRLSLLLPLALPGYLLAYVYADFFEFAGPAQSLLRDWLDCRRPEDCVFFEVRSIGMAGLLLGVGLSPYVFAFTTASLDQHARNAFETARVLGLGPWRSFVQVILPLARPAWVAGLLLVAMETIADFGTVQHLAVDTLTLGIFTTWLERGDLVTAARLALLAGSVILVIGAWENHQRGARSFHSSLTPKLHRGLSVSKRAGCLMVLACATPFVIGFAFPVTVLVVFGLQNLPQFVHADFLSALLQTLYLACVATAVGTLVAALVALTVPRTCQTRWFLHGAFLGYMLPGTIFALGLMLFLVPLGQKLQQAGLIEVSLLGGIFGLIYGYVARFFAISHGVIRTGVEMIPASIDDAGKIYGWKPLAVWLRVKLPILRGHILCAMIVMFVETLKELPLTLIIRPPGMETLATHLYHYAADENLSMAAPGALVIVLMGVVAVLVLGWLRRV
ncbi:MAG: iron ABC transporter permease [Alphaproteobacteria bacterium]|nr:iron ABC transporter permease [Alphaproteobacteria bacterium]